MSAIKFVDLQGQYQTIKQEILVAIEGVLDTSAYVLGPAVQAFEQEFAALHGADHGIAVNTGTSALHVALLAAGVGAGDEVITTPMTFTATAAAISYTNATPVFVDIDPATKTIDPAKIAEKITARTKAILPVHLYGQMADMDPIMAIARDKGLTVIEDACQAHVAEYKGRRAGGIGQIGCYSFYPGKNLGAYGEGGLIVTSDPDLAERMRMLRDWGQTKRYHHDMLAYNYRMDGIQGAILRVKLKRLEAWTERRRALAKLYQSLFEGSGVQCATEAQDRRHVYHLFSVFHPQRNQLQQHLHAAEIQTGIHYPIPVHLQKAYADLGHRRGDFPHTEKAADEQLSLPMYPELTETEVMKVAETVRNFQQ